MNHRIFCLCMVVMSASVLPAQTIQVNKENKTIAITATDSAEREADTAEISIGFTSYGADQDQTYADASRISNQIVKALTDAGVKREQIQSEQQNLTGLDDNDKARFAKGIRFVFNQGWKVTTRASSAADVLHLAVTNGANNSGAIEWRLADDNTLEAEAAEKALAHAQQIAQRMAAGLNAKLGSLIYASNEQPQRNFLGRAMLQTQSASLGREQKNLKPLAISPDKVTRSATVYAVFAIE